MATNSMTSMAATLAASLPKTSPAPAAPQPKYEAIPASMAKVIDIEAEIPLTSVQLDGMVVSKIIKHAREAPSAVAHGLLLGLDLDGTLEVSNSFPLPSHDDDERSAKTIFRHQTSILRSLKEVQADDSVVGFYQATTSGVFFNQTLVDTQVTHQEKLRHGGVVIIHDISQTARGNASFRAYRLTPRFMDAYKKSNFNTASLINNQLTFSSILEQVPLKIRTNPLLSSFLGTLTKSIPSPLVDASTDEAYEAAVTPSYSTLDLGTANVTRNLQQITEAIDSYRAEDGNVSYMLRQIARERAKADNYIAKRQEENQVRIAQGLVPLPEEDVSRLFKIPSEPDRLPSMLLLGHIDACAEGLGHMAGTSLVKMYAAKASAGI